jgi:hypothetical protein
MRAAYDLNSDQSDRKRNSEKANVEYRIMNIECRRNVFYLFNKKMERSDSTLRNSAVRYSIFCGSLFNPGYRSRQSKHQETGPFWCRFI